MSLRAELIGATEAVPAFAILLPEGWAAVEEDFGRAEVASALAVLPPAQRAMLAPRLEQLLTAGAEQAARGNVIRSFAQRSTAADSFLPLSLVASRMDAPAGTDIAGVGAELIASRGAASLDEGGTILRWTETTRTRIEDADLGVETVHYLLPIPGRPLHGLLFQAAILREAEGNRVDEDGIVAMRGLCDAIVATVRWRRDA